jgi:hypothetical protein
LFGYRRAEVDAELARHGAEIEERERRIVALGAELEAARGRVRELELVAERLSECAAGREAELGRVRAELDLARAEALTPMRTLVALVREIEGIRTQARSQATRIRMAALREAAYRERVETPADPVPDSPLMRELAEAEAAVGSGGELSARAHAGEAGGGDRSGAMLGPGPSRAPAAAASRVAEDIFVGSVEIEIGPLSDFSQLVGFEDAAAAIGAVAEVSVTRFAQSRATFAVRLAEPAELVRELAERAPFGFEAREMRAERIVLDVLAG